MEILRFQVPGISADHARRNLVGTAQGDHHMREIAADAFLLLESVAGSRRLIAAAGFVSEIRSGPFGDGRGCNAATQRTKLLLDEILELVGLAIAAGPKIMDHAPGQL